MFSALTIIPALIGGSGPFMDGVLLEFDRRGGYRFWGMKRRIHIPGESLARAARRQARAPARRGRRAGSAGRVPSSADPGPPRSSRSLVLVALALPALNLRLGSSDAGVDPPGHDHAQGLRPDRRGLRGRHERLVPARRRAAAKGRQGRRAADRRRGRRRPGLHLRLAADALAGRPGGDDHRLPARRARRTRRRPTRSSACATTSCPPVEKTHGRDRSRSAASPPRRRTSRAWSPASCRCSSAWSSC